MIPTTTDELSSLFATAIEGITPRLTYKGAEEWKLHTRPNDRPTTTRRCRLLWGTGNVQPGGARAGQAIENFVTLRVQTDYAGELSKMQHAIDDDFHQLGDTLASLRGADKGLVTVERVRTAPVIGRPGRDDNVRVDHLYTVRFIRQIQL